MIDNKVKKYTYKQLVDWISNEIGTSDTSYFKSNTQINSGIQQVPEEYANLLLWFKQTDFKTYLEIGVASGVSFLINVIFQEGLESSDCVDNVSYTGLDADQFNNISTKVNWLNENKNASTFFNSNSDVFFKNNNKTYDCIFIDGDHSYEGVKQDYENAIKILNDGGYLIFHDMASDFCPGVTQLWNEIKNDNCIEFVESNTCGIGIWKNK